MADEKIKELQERILKGRRLIDGRLDLLAGLPEGPEKEKHKKAVEEAEIRWEELVSEVRRYRVGPEGGFEPCIFGFFSRCIGKVCRMCWEEMGERR